MFLSVFPVDREARAKKCLEVFFCLEFEALPICHRQWREQAKPKGTQKSHIVEKFFGVYILLLRLRLLSFPVTQQLMTQKAEVNVYLKKALR